MLSSLRRVLTDAWSAWQAFWFTPTDPSTLCLIRVLAGGMLFYTHLVWSKGLTDFFDPTAGWNGELLPVTHANPFYFSVFDYIAAPWLRWTVHVAFLLVFLLLTLGLYSRLMAVLALFAALSYVERVTPGAFFGLDKANVMLAMCLAVGPCGARYSLDRWRAERRGAGGAPPPRASANLAIRLLQWHLCAVYLFGGLGKLQGDMWWDGRAVWFAVASYEYRSIDATWLAWRLPVVDFLTHATVALELFYCCGVWNRWTRPWVVLGIMGMHAFIGGAMGMITFGLAMMIANLAFVSPAVVRWVVDPLAARLSTGPAPRAAAAPA